MDDQACPKCKTTLYRNPNMKLMVNVCGHNLCESCVELLFVKGSGSCPECGIALRRNNFRIQLFEDALIDKEVDIRKRILRDFNKKEEDFSTLKEFNDYLEMVEDIIFNLSNNIDILETNKKIAEYKEKNKELINKNRYKVSREALEIQDMLAEEDRLNIRRVRETKLEEMEEQKAKAESKQKLIEDLMFSEADAEQIVSQHQNEAAKKSSKLEHERFSEMSAASINQLQVSSIPVNEVDKSVKFEYHPHFLHLDGPELPGEGDAVQRRYCDFVRRADPSEVAGGFTEQMPCLRALQEAMCGLFY